MNSFLKYIIYFILGLMIHLLLKDNLIEGYGENVFQLLARIIGQGDNNDYRSPYMGCQKYECDNKPKYSFEELDSKELEELQGILREKINETRLTLEDIDYINRKYAIREILKIENFSRYVDKESLTDLDYLTCNNEMHYSSASLLGGQENRCNRDKCCFNTKCSSEDVQDLKGNDGTSLSCLDGTNIKKNANCFNKQTCKNNYRTHCCTRGIDEDSQSLFDDISGETDSDSISYGELKTYIQNIPDVRYSDSELNEKLHKLLSIDSVNTHLDNYDLLNL